MPIPMRIVSSRDLPQDTEQVAPLERAPSPVPGLITTRRSNWAHQPLHRILEQDFLNRDLRFDPMRAGIPSDGYPFNYEMSSFRGTDYAPSYPGNIQPMEVEEELSPALFCRAEKLMAGFLLFVVVAAIILVLFMFHLL